MNTLVAALLESAQKTLDSESAAKSSNLLRDKQMRMLDSQPTHELVSQLLPTLQARQKNAAYSGTCIYGLAETIEELSKIELDTAIEGYAFMSPTLAGVFYFREKIGHGILGAAIVDLR
jgi:hypothetical protein